MSDGPPARRGPRTRLWMKLAVLAALGVLVLHALHLWLGSRIANEALVRQQEALGRSVARLLAHEAAEAVLVDDPIALFELTANTVAGGEIAYCLVTRDGRLLAGSFGKTKDREAIVSARAPREREPLVLVHGGAKFLDIAQPILDGHGGVVRIGLDMATVRATRQRTAFWLGLVALGVVGAGLAAAFVVGRRIAQPVGRLLAAADSFEPSRAPPPIETGSDDEIGELAERFELMMRRLRAAYEEQERARQKEATTERMAALGALVGGIAHEINNPLAGLQNCLSRVQRDDLHEPKRREYLALMEEAVGRIERVVRDLLDFGRPRPVELEAVLVGDLLREGTQLIRPLLRQRGIVLSEEPLAGDLAARRVVADRSQIGQALLNLLLNAAYVTPGGGEIRVRVRERRGWLGIAVEDDGPGIPAEIRDRVLDPFFSTKPAGEGTGLGLSVTKSILDAHAGRLDLDCPGRGTIATVWLLDAGTPPLGAAAAPSDVRADPMGIG